MQQLKTSLVVNKKNNLQYIQIFSASAMVENKIQVLQVQQKQYIIEIFFKKTCPKFDLYGSEI